MAGKITYHHQVVFCGKSNCLRCRNERGHGPYWYAYQTVNGRTKKTYIGKNLPPGVSTEDISEDSALLRLLTLGQVFRLEHRIQGEWQPVHETTWSKHRDARQLLEILASSPNRSIPHDEVYRLLWPHIETNRAVKKLHQTLQDLQNIIESPVQENTLLSQSGTLLQDVQGVLVLAGQAQFWVDADAFKDLITQAHTATNRSQTEQLLEEAAQLYLGDFLSKEIQITLVKSRRESLHRTWIGLLLELADVYIDRENMPGAIDALDRLLTADIANEAATQRFMVILAQANRRNEALEMYQRFMAALSEGLMPSQSIQMLSEAVRKGESIPLSWTRKHNESRGERSDAPEKGVVPIGRTHQSPLVGRSKEIEHITHMLFDVETRTTKPRAHCVVLMGDVGIGKTRLAEEMVHEAQKRNVAVAWGGIYTQESAVPYRIWIEALRKAHTQGLWQFQEITRRPFLYQPLRSLLPELQDLLPQELQALPEQEQSRLWEAMCVLLSTMCENTPLLIVLDDLQWADRSSCELLAYLIRHMSALPVYFVSTCRDSELSASHHLRTLLTDLQREQAVEILSVGPLNTEQVHELLTDLPKSLAERISARVSGNPLFAEELAREAVSSDLMQLPETIQAVLNLRLERISLPCQHLLERAAVLGDAFQFDIIHAMASGGMPADEDTIIDLIEEALQAGMLTEEGNGLSTTYRFWHPLLLTYLYERLSIARRARLHRRAAQVLQEHSVGHEMQSAADITYHLVNGGGTPTLVAHYAELAADHAYAISAYPSAEKHYRLALEYLGDCMPNAKQDERLHHAYLLEQLTECTRVQGHYQEARHLYEHLLQMGNNQHISAAQNPAQDEKQREALLWIEIGRSWYDTNNHTQAQDCYRKGEEILHEAKIVHGPVWAYLQLQKGYTSWRSGHFEEAEREAREAFTFFKDFSGQTEVPETQNFSRLTRIQRILQGDPVMLGHIHRLLAAIAAASGHSADALSHLNTSLEIFEQYDQKQEIAIICCSLGDVYLRTSEYVSAQAVLRRSIDIAEDIHDLPMMCVGFGNLGVLHTRLGDLGEAEKQYRRDLALAEQINDAVYINLGHSYLAPVLQDQGKISEASLSIRKALRIGRAVDIPLCIGSALIALGHFHIVQARMCQVQDNEQGEIKPQKVNEGIYRRHVNQARKSLQRALMYEGLEAEGRIDGQVALAEVALLSGDVENAYQQAFQTFNDAQACELIWLVAGSQRLLGCVLAAQGQHTNAHTYFQQALATFERIGMRLEYARTLQAYGVSLWQNSSLTDRQQASHYLEESRQIFRHCHATLDLQTVEQLIAL